ncbi:MAG: hypothetical protein IJ745_00560 [Bacteroidales bacterium]|nr:hypothetical protein [Bacteroidales bacterium]
MPDLALGQAEEVWDMLDSLGYDGLTEEQRRMVDLMEYDEVFMHFYSSACSWYCGGMIDTVTATSAKAADSTTYIGANAHDWDIFSAWLTAEDNNGVGAMLTYTFPARCPRITTVLIHNGYLRTADDWLDYSRVKQLRVYYDGKRYADLLLDDTRDLQEFDVGVLGFIHDEERTAPWTLCFEIMEVYPGRKYTNAAITELYFEGIDVH